MLEQPHRQSGRSSPHPPHLRIRRMKEVQSVTTVCAAYRAHTHPRLTNSLCCGVVFAAYRRGNARYTLSGYPVGPATVEFESSWSCGDEQVSVSPVPCLLVPVSKRGYPEAQFI